MTVLASAFTSIELDEVAPVPEVQVKVYVSLLARLPVETPPVGLWSALQLAVGIPQLPPELLVTVQVDAFVEVQERVAAVPEAMISGPGPRIGAVVPVARFAKI